MAASLELQVGGRLLRDPGAVRDLTDSLAEGLRRHVAEVRKRMPRASILLQLDEPSLPTVIAGHVPTESGLSVYRAVDGPDAATALRTITEAVGVPVVVHCCAPDVPLQVVRDAGAVAVALDLALLKDLDPLGELLEAGLGLFAGAAATMPPSDGRAPSSAKIAERVRELWTRLSFPPGRLPEQVVVTPACGLAGASEKYARAVLEACRDAGRRLAEV
jgi:methionine synthase II (cobalamin-independent)